MAGLPYQVAHRGRCGEGGRARQKNVAEHELIPPSPFPTFPGLSWSSHEYLTRVFERPAVSVSAMDRPLLYILIALAGTLLLFAAGVIPYPFGLIVLTLLALGRFLQIKGPA